MSTGEFIVNSKYKYLCDDVIRILHARLDQENLGPSNNIFTIAPIGEGQNTLVTFVNEEKTRNASSPNRTLLIPYLTGDSNDGHWVGFLIKYENNIVSRVEYYDSLGQPVTSKVVRDLKVVYGDDLCNKLGEIRHYVIVQNDFSSCGPCMIENLVNAVKQTRNILPVLTIRENHILLMRNDCHGQDFYERQKDNRCITNGSQDRNKSSVLNDLHPRGEQDYKYVNGITKVNNKMPGNEAQKGSFALNRGVKRSMDYENDLARQCVDAGNRLLKEHNITGAINKYDQAIKERPNYAIAHYNKRIALSMQNDVPSNSIEHREIDANVLIDKVKDCSLGSSVDPYFVINIIAAVPERRFSDDSSSEEPDEEFNELYEKSAVNNDWPFTTRHKKTTKLKRGVKVIEAKFSYKNQDTADSTVVGPLLSKLLINAFERYDRDKLSTIAVSIGLNRIYSLSTRKNKSLIIELESKDYTTGIKYRKFAYYWKCAWYTNDGKPANFEDVRKFYKRLKNKNPDLARKFIEDEEHIGTERNALHVPYQDIREHAKNHPETKKLIKGFRDDNPSSMIYLHLVDADVLDFNGVYSAYLRIIDGCYEPPTVMSTGYEFLECTENRAHGLLGRMDRMHRVITTFHIPLGTYYPEPNMCILIPEHCETVEESFIDRRRGNCLESPILLNNIQNRRKKVYAIFSEDSPIITNVPLRAKVRKNTKQPLNFSSEFKEGLVGPTHQDIKTFDGVSQSHSNKLTWCKSVFINNSIKCNNNYETDDECIYNKKNEPLKGVDKQCTHLIGKIRKGDDVERCKSKLANRIGEDNATNIVNAIEDISRFNEDFDKKYTRTPEEQEFIDLMKKHDMPYDGLSRESLLRLIDNEAVVLIKEHTSPNLSEKVLLKKVIDLFSAQYEEEYDNLTREHDVSLDSIISWDSEKIDFLGSGDVVRVTDRFGDSRETFQQIEDLYDRDDELACDIIEQICASEENLIDIDFDDLITQYVYIVQRMQWPDQEYFELSMEGANIIDVIARENNYDSESYRLGFALAKRSGMIDSDCSSPPSSHSEEDCGSDEDVSNVPSSSDGTGSSESDEDTC